jgi:hypothetical protein
MDFTFNKKSETTMNNQTPKNQNLEHIKARLIKAYAYNRF